ncbi:hypothetical protein PMPD1_3895 [Paramixta manurensis]|uniref:Bacteriocin n=1 Tax=Paramixta manurensis TaxID=2740817 RepID=A0A6M8UE15_9GAMM|nr:hypothetical protein PMPD1_3895 [Erwiniaceae bacterium PD-1]
MRELNNKEVANISGGFFIANIGEKIGLSIGNAVSEDVSAAAAQLGKGIGYIIELNVVGAVREMSEGIRGIVDWFKSR